MFQQFEKLVTTRKNYNTISFDDLISRIQTRNAYVDQAREFDKKKNRKAYDSVKLDKIEAIQPNSFNGISTGYIFLDIDDFDSTADAIEYKRYLTEKHYDIITACWLSLSNYGLSILVRTDGVTDRTFSEYWNTLRILFEGKIDKRTNDFKKLCCISYDPDVYINTNAKPFTLEIENIFNSLIANPPVDVNISKDGSSNYKKPPVEVNIDKDIISTSGGVTILYKTEIEDSYFKDVNYPVFFPDGKKVLNLDLPKLYKNKIKEGKRNSTLGAISMKLIVLNPNVQKGALFNSLMNINRKYCEVPMSSQEVYNLFESNYKKFSTSGFDLSEYEETKYVFFHRNCTLSAKAKKSMGNLFRLKKSGMGKENSERAIAEAITALLSSSKRISVESIAKESSLSKRTVERYYKPFKTMIQKYNRELTMDKKKEETTIQQPIEAGTVDVNISISTVEVVDMADIPVLVVDDEYLDLPI